jgi:pSer/pThr/pTyr-binding forkhead associated (FHA) protein
MEIFDTASKNGTMVNGSRIEKCCLNVGDEITLARNYVLMLSDLAE